MSYKILRTPADELVPDPKIPYVDYQGTFDDCLDYLVPDDEARFRTCCSTATTASARPCWRLT